MKRTPLKPKIKPKIKPRVKLERVAQVHARLTVQVRYPVFGDVVSIPKEAPVRSEEYRRLVAAMPCAYCGIEGFSQAAHVPPDGRGLKQDDRLTFALCCARPGITGCHQDYDQWRMFPRNAAVILGMAWAADTRRVIEASGFWPKNLPKWSES